MNGQKKYVNIACGTSYIEGWVNLDFISNNPAVIEANLIDGIPLPANYADILYVSHFIEHIPRNKINLFLSECFRVLKKNGGCIRIVCPDLEELSRSYLSCRDQDLHDEADFIMTEIIDQCTRGIPGGELGKYYHKIISEKNNKMIDFVRERTGQKLPVEIKQLNLKQDFFKSFPNRANNYIKYRYIQALIFMLPSAFKQQNVSLTHTGEKHTWIYDFYSLKKLLSRNGFTNINKFTFNTSKIIGFPFFPLDIDEEGLSRKGSESMYIEAIRV